MVRGDWCYVDGFGDQRVFVPDVKIEKDDPTYVYRPCRGYSASLAVEDIDGKIIGWIDTTTLGYFSAKHWMISVNYLTIDKHFDRR